MGLGGIALANLVNPVRASASTPQDRGVLGGQLHVPAKAKRVIYLFMAGGPSMELRLQARAQAAQRRAAA
jgi:hypothetical protein